MAKEAGHKFGVSNLAKDLKRSGASVRASLRALDVDVTKDGTYGWDSRDAYEKVLKRLKARSENAGAALKKKPAKKKTSKKSAPAEAHSE